MVFRVERKASGFTLVEMTIVLAVVGALVAGMWSLFSAGNIKMREQAAANQHKQLIAAVKSFLQTSEGKDWMLRRPANGNLIDLPISTATCAVNLNHGLNNNLSGLCTFLPPGMTRTTRNAFGQNYRIQFIKDTAAGTAPNTYSFMILTTGGDPIPDASGGSIAGMIGGDGGYIYTNGGCAINALNRPQTACGAYGAWRVDRIRVDYGFGTSAGGHIASRSFYSALADSMMPWLSRDYLGPGVAPAVANDVFFNRMNTDMYLGGHNLYFGTFTNPYVRVVTIPPTPDPATSINVQGGSINLNVAGTNTSGGTINMQGGTISMVNGGGTIDLGASGTITGLSNTTVLLNSEYLFLTGDMRVAGTKSLVKLVGNTCMTGPGSPANCQFVLDAVGDVSITGLLTANSLWAGTHLYASSDERLKTSIRALSGSLADIMKLRPVSFIFKSDGKESMGLIAQDVEKVFPQLVVTTGNEKMKAVEYNGLIAPLIEAVQELKRENEELRKELNIQNEAQKRIERELNLLQKR